MNKEALYAATGVTSHKQLEQWLESSIRNPAERQKLYCAVDDLSVDTFKNYFEEYSAERKTNMQDYTPDSVATILAGLTGRADRSYDGAAGTGALLIAHWWRHKSDGAVYTATEYADNVIPYLVHNLCMRKMDAVVVHGDTIERACADVYIIKNGAINVLPHNDLVMRDFDVRSWTQDGHPYFEDEEVRGIYAKAQ